MRPLLEGRKALMKPVPAIRVRTVHPAQVREKGSFVLYWMTASRRVAHNYGLQRAVEHCVRLNKPLVILEALRCDYPYASDRLHAFILQGMADNLEACRSAGVCHHPYVETARGEGKGLLHALGSRACVVVTDLFPCFFLPRMLAAASRDLPVGLEAVDSCGLLPLQAAGRVFTTAASFRRFVQKGLHEHLAHPPERSPLSALAHAAPVSLPREIRNRWPAAGADTLRAGPEALARLPLDHGVAPVATPGGSRAGRGALDRFLRTAMGRYDTDANHPDRHAVSGLSPYLHFGHVSAHEVFSRVAGREGWRATRAVPQATGSRAGWWGMRPGAEAFLDQLVTWRELGYNLCFQREDYDRYESLPGWARETLERHAGDPRPYLYGPEAFRDARTHDPLWNAAQRQLLREGTIHNYLRMLWGKKILHWTSSPRQALEIMLELNDRYALDGRDPNSYNGIFWILGRYDRAWGPERPVFGKVRYMTSRSTARKLELRAYLERFSSD